MGVLSFPILIKISSSVKFLKSALDDLKAGIMLFVIFSVATAPIPIAIGIGAVATENMTNNMIPALRSSRADFKNLTDEEILIRIGKERTPIGRAGKPEEIAALAVFLASERSGFITGDTIEASGGADRFL